AFLHCDSPTVAVHFWRLSRGPVRRRRLAGTRTMLTPSEERAAALAVARFGASSDAVQAALEAGHQAQSKGERAELLDMMVLQELLSPNQADDLRRALETTNLDANVIIHGNGAAAARSGDRATTEDRATYSAVPPSPDRATPPSAVARSAV